MIVVSGLWRVHRHAAIGQCLLPPWNVCVTREVRDVMGSTDAALRLVLYLDPGTIGKVNVSLEVCDLYSVARCIRADRCSGLAINNAPSCDSRESRGRWLE